jgi:hypothetical protein
MDWQMAGYGKGIIVNNMDDIPWEIQQKFRKYN